MIKLCIFACHATMCKINLNMNKIKHLKATPENILDLKLLFLRNKHCRSVYNIVVMIKYIVLQVR